MFRTQSAVIQQKSDRSDRSTRASSEPPPSTNKVIGSQGQSVRRALSSPIEPDLDPTTPVNNILSRSKSSARPVRKALKPSPDPNFESEMLSRSVSYAHMSTSDFEDDDGDFPESPEPVTPSSGPDDTDFVPTTPPSQARMQTNA